MMIDEPFLSLIVFNKKEILSTTVLPNNIIQSFMTNLM